MAKAPDKLAIEQLCEAYLASETCSGFFACSGSGGNRIVAMETCHTCATHIILRRALKRMGITPPDDINDRYRKQEERFKELRR
jgi:hypothetical protein